MTRSVHRLANRSLLLCALVMMCAWPARAQVADDSAAIRRTALDYIEGWYTGDAARMERALHPELAKRRVSVQNGRPLLDQQSAMTLVQGTRAGYGKSIPAAKRRNDVTILDIYGNVASVRVDASDWVDYLHLVRWGGEWKIINVLWELRPEEH